MKRELDGVNILIRGIPEYQWKEFKRSDVIFIYRVGWNPPSRKFGFIGNQMLYLDPKTWTRVRYRQVIMELKSIA